jgi:hypothetical protein
LLALIRGLPADAAAFREEAARAYQGDTVPVRKPVTRDPQQIKAFFDKLRG